MSCVPPSDYQERFIQYMKTKFVSLTNDNNNSKSIFDSKIYIFIYLIIKMEFKYN